MHQHHSIPRACTTSTGNNVSPPIRQSLLCARGVLGGLFLALVVVGTAAAFPPPTGTAASGLFRGWIQKCGTSACVTWIGSARGMSAWIATLIYEDGSYRYTIRPYEQSTLLSQGKTAWGAGIFPRAAWSTDVFDRAGNRIIAGFRTSGGSCWDSLVNQNDLFSAGCSTGGFVIWTRQYPPGSIRAYFDWYDPGAVGMIGGSYRGDLW